MSQSISTTARTVVSPLKNRIQNCTLEVIKGPDQGQKLAPLPEYALIGRNPYCDLVLSDEEVSGRHCELFVDSRQITLRDLESTNGTLCGKYSIIEALLEPDQTFDVGNSTIRVSVHEGHHSVVRFPYDATGNLIGTGETMQRLFNMMNRVAPHPIPIVFLGETGTGKTAAARAVHKLSSRSESPFLSINCGSLPAELAESTLFGHVKGAFTGAVKSQPGIFEQARGGSILLDEIGELPPALQPKLLHVLETKRVRPVGGDKELSVDFRLFTATNRALEQEVRNGRFRQDLYYRIAGMELVVPPLRDRIEDLEPLAQLFLAQHAEKLGDSSVPKMLSPEALNRLGCYPWPGNVREFRNVLGRAVVLAEDSEILADDILFSSWTAPGEQDLPLQDDSYSTSQYPPEFPVRKTEDGASEETIMSRLDDSYKTFKEAVNDKYDALYLKHLIERTQGNVSKASRLAELSRSYLRVMLKKHNI